MGTESKAPLARRQARLRLAIVSTLLANPPIRGELVHRVKKLAETVWQTPDGAPVMFGFSTIERWYYQCRNADDPLSALLRAIRRDAGTSSALQDPLLAALEQQYAAHPSWSYQLHADNIVALCKEAPDTYGAAPSYPTIRRAMQRRGWTRRRAPRNPTDRQLAAATHLEKFEVRSFEVEAVHALWHWDFHECSRRVVDSKGVWHTPQCFCILDDRSRLCCHIQWYLVESAENLVHGLRQAILKRGLPRGALSDNGGAMIAAETKRGLLDLSIDLNLTLPYSPYQNGKQESFWGQIEGRFLKMIERVKPLTLEFLNRATQAWVELEYNHKHHDELGCSPIERALAGPDVSRPAPTMQVLQRTFTAQQTRIQRRSDGTVSIKGVRFEIPNRLRTLRRPTVRFRRWDLSEAWIVDPRTLAKISRILPLDKLANADGRRRTLTDPESSARPVPTSDADPLPPLMRELLADYAATGLPPAYLPKEE